jgi:hypothetical protein
MLQVNLVVVAYRAIRGYGSVPLGLEPLRLGASLPLANNADARHAAISRTSAAAAQDSRARGPGKVGEGRLARRFCG